MSHPIAARLKRAGAAEHIAILVLLFSLLTAATASMTSLLTGPDWISLWVSLLLGLLAGWGLAILHWRPWLSALLVLGLGVLFGLLFAGGLGVKLLVFIEALFRQVATIPAWVKARQVDLGLLANAAHELSAAAGVVVSRVVGWVKNLANGQAAFDPVAAGLVWGLVVWLVSAWAGWVVEARHNTLLAVLPALGLNLSTLSYARSTSPIIYLALGITLVLLGLVQFDQRKQEWDQTRIAYPQHKGRQVGNTSIILSIGLVILAALLSTFSFERIQQLASRLNPPNPQGGNPLAKSLGVQQPTPTTSPFATALSPGLPRQLLVGAGPELSKEQVMSVEVNDLPSLLESGGLPPLYWRSFTYDIYTGHGWSASPTVPTAYPSDQPFQAAQLPGHLLVQQTINQLPGQSGTLYAAGEALSADVSSLAAWRSNQDLFGIQTSASSYTVSSLISLAAEESLRAAGETYPDWIVRRYLSLPAEVPARVKQLAIQLTATQPTPYDRARAIEQYLRSSYPYSTDVPYPPANQDLVDYFLFDLRKGYCDDYASAMVVLARAAGIPARLAIGYASGTYNLNSGRFIVTQADAHSWAEVYFPGLGWVPFEPTAARPAINRSAQPLAQATPPAAPTQPASSPGGRRLAGRIAVYLALGVLAVLASLYAIFDEIYLSQLAPRLAAAEIYRRLKRYGRLLEVASESSQTPGEYAMAMQARLAGLDPQRSAKQAQLGAQVQALIQQIVRLSYRPSEAGEANQPQLLKRWRLLRWQLRLAWVRAWWKTRLAPFGRDIAGGREIQGSR